MTALFSRAASDALHAPPLTTVPPQQLDAEYARIIAEHTEEQKRDRRRERGGNLLTILHGCTTLALAAALAALLPLKSIVPVFVELHNDGSYTSTISQSELPRGLQEAATMATLWLYVRAREGYSSATWREDQKIVYMLSDKGAGDIYESLTTSRNKESPSRKYGKRTTIRLERISEQFICALETCFGREPDAYQVRFNRIVHTEGQSEQSLPWVASVRFHRVPAIPAWQRVTYNPLGLQVVQYRAEEEGTK